MFDWQKFEPINCTEILWDFIVIGAGMGGSVAGLSLAQKGFSVLFLERGGSPQGGPCSLQQGRLKRWLRVEAPEVRLAKMGRWPQRLTLVQAGRQIDFF